MSIAIDLFAAVWGIDFLKSSPHEAVATVAMARRHIDLMGIV